MAKKADDKVNPNKLASVAKTIADTLSGLEGAGNEVTAICGAVQNLYHGKAIPDNDLDFLLDEIARHRKWTNKSADKRKSETRAIITASENLPATIERVENQGLPVAFYNAVKLARMLNGGKTVAQAASTFLAKPKKRDVSGITRTDARNALAGKVKAMLKYTKALTKAERDALAAWALSAGLLEAK